MFANLCLLLSGLVKTLNYRLQMPDSFLFLIF